MRKLLILLLRALISTPVYSAKALKHVHGGTIVDFYTEVARGNVVGAKIIHKFGSNQDVDVGVEDVWEQGGLINWPASALTMNATSSSTADDSAGTGCRTLVIEGLDATLLEISETVILDGQVIVTTGNDYRRINRVYCSTFGSGMENAGTVYIFTGTETTGVPDTATLIYTTIFPDHGQTLQAFYTVPADKTAYLLDGTLSTDAAAKPVEGKFYVRTGVLDADSGWRIQAHFKTGDFYPKGYVGPPMIPGGTDLKVEATGTANNTFVSATYDLLVIDN